MICLNKIDLYIDVDNTIIASNIIMIQMYEEITGEKSLRRESLTWNLTDCFPNVNKQIIHDMFESPRFFELASQSIYDGCKYSLEALEPYYNIYFVSCGTDANLKLKMEWIYKEFPKYNFIPLRQGKQTFNKSICRNGVIIDDRLDCLASSQDCYKVLFNYMDLKYEWQEGHIDLWKNGKINYISYEWDSYLRKQLKWWHMYSNQ